MSSQSLGKDVLESATLLVGASHIPLRKTSTELFPDFRSVYYKGFWFVDGHILARYLALLKRWFVAGPRLDRPKKICSKCS